MKLIIAENPSVAKAIAPVVGANTKQDEYTEGNGYIVTLLTNAVKIILTKNIAAISVAVGDNSSQIIECKTKNSNEIGNVHLATIKNWILELRKKYIDNNIDAKCTYFNKEITTIEPHKSNIENGFIL